MPKRERRQTVAEWWNSRDRDRSEYGYKFSVSPNFLPKEDEYIEELMTVRNYSRYLAVVSIETGYMWAEDPHPCYINDWYIVPRGESAKDYAPRTRRRQLLKDADDIAGMVTVSYSPDPNVCRSFKVFVGTTVTGKVVGVFTEHGCQRSDEETLYIVTEEETTMS